MLDIIFRNDALVVVNKPSGISVHRGEDRDPPFMLQRVRDQVGQWVYPIHRLDRATSGVLLFALSPEFAAQIGKQFEARAVIKTYIALVRGVPDAAGRIDHPIAAEKGAPKRDAVTDFERLWIYKKRYSLLRCVPSTGRKHQIRRHLKHISRPIIGDVRYGKGVHNRLFRSEHDLHRLALHASSLRLMIPGEEAPRTLDAPMPPDLADPLLRMGAPLPRWGLIWPTSDTRHQRHRDTVGGADEPTE